MHVVSSSQRNAAIRFNQPSAVSPATLTQAAVVVGSRAWRRVTIGESVGCGGVPAEWI